MWIPLNTRTHTHAALMHIAGIKTEFMEARVIKGIGYTSKYNMLTYAPKWFTKCTEWVFYKTHRTLEKWIVMYSHRNNCFRRKISDIIHTIFFSLPCWICWWCSWQPVCASTTQRYLNLNCVCTIHTWTRNTAEQPVLCGAGIVCGSPSINRPQ